uniref:Uncharacterized protein n=1 Tax=Octopus bimaculoides TaxID=37653 RepID=A0A0L8G1E6_OCTBM
MWTIKLPQTIHAIVIVLRLIMDIKQLDDSAIEVLTVPELKKYLRLYGQIFEMFLQIFHIYLHLSHSHVAGRPAAASW